MHTLRALYRGQEALYGADSGLDPVAHLHTFTATEGCGHELVVIREREQQLDIALALDEALLQRLCARAPADVLGDDSLADAKLTEKARLETIEFREDQLASLCRQRMVAGFCPKRRPNPHLRWPVS
ncbi:MAG TPA: hypothetical protein ENJ18_12300 [Nannocystis exedens]|nr:hypothetical protein [Nannocystis exedens]